MLADKVIDLLSKILENQTETNSQLKELTSQVKKIEMNVENDLGYKIKAFYMMLMKYKMKRMKLLSTL